MNEEMLIRVQELVALHPNQDAHLLREKIQKEFAEKEIYVTNDTLYYAILEEMDKYKPVEPIQEENNEEIITDPVTGLPIG